MGPQMCPGWARTRGARRGCRNQKNLGKRNVWGPFGGGPNGCHRVPLEQISGSPFRGGFEGSFGAVLGPLGRSFCVPRAGILDPLWGAVLEPSLDSFAQALKPGSDPRLCIQAQHVGFESKLGIRPLNSGSESWLGMMVMTPGSESRC